MLKYIKNILSKNKTSRLNFIECSMENLPQLSFKQFLSGGVDCVLVRNVLTENDCLQICEKLKSLSYIKKDFKKGESFTYPINLSVANATLKNDSSYLDKYFDYSKGYLNFFKNNFTVDIPQAIDNVFQKIDPNHKLNKVEVEHNGTRETIIPFTFRITRAIRNKFTIHCGNKLSILYDEFYRLINSEININEQLSYFLMMQKPEKGGELILFNHRWSKMQKGEVTSIQNLDQYKAEEIASKNGTLKLNMQNGDLVIFNGGDLYHKIDKFEGQFDRITFGGFLGFSKNSKKNKIFTWS